MDNEQAFVYGWVAAIRRGDPYHNIDGIEERTARRVFRTKVNQNEE